MVGGAQGLTVALAAGALLAASAVPAQTMTVEGSCRDGQPHGAYELKGPKGEVRAVGAFARGQRTGSFLFWSSTGARLAQLPFDEDQLSGTLALWYPPARPGGEATRKLEAVYARGRLAGLKRSWYPDGRARAEFRYDDGVLVAARAYTPKGAPLPDAEARAMAARDLASDDEYYATLDATVRANLPRCEPASDRLEKG